MKRVTAAPARDSIHVLIFVTNIEKSLEFYRETLGLDTDGEVQTPFGTSHRLRYGTSLIKLMDPKQVPAAGPAGIDQQLGLRCVSFAVTNITELCASLAARGVEFTIPETRVLPDTRIAMVKDPDGNIVEFVDRS